MGMVAILISGPWPFVQLSNPPLSKGSTWNLKKIGPGLSEEKSFKDVDGRGTASDHNSSPWAFSSGELNNIYIFKYSILRFLK